jgi:hypothetical protein
VGGQARKAEDYTDDELAAIIARADEPFGAHDTKLIEGVAIEEDVMAESVRGTRP